MRVVGHDERSVACDGHAAVRAGATFAENALVTRLDVAPQLAPRRGVERVPFIPAADVHDAVGNRGCDLEARRARDGKHPGRAEPLDVGRVDLLELAETIAGETAVIKEPDGLGRDRFLAIDIAGPRAQHELP